MRMKSQPHIHQPVPSENKCPSDPAALRACFTFGSLQFHVHLPCIIRTKPPQAPQIAYLNVTQSAAPQNPNPHIHPLPMTFGLQPSPGPYTPKKRPHHQQAPSTNVHRLSGSILVAPQAAMSMTEPCVCCCISSVATMDVTLCI